MSPYIQGPLRPTSPPWPPNNQTPKRGARALPAAPYAAPGLAFLYPQQQVLLGLENFEINIPSTTVEQIPSEEEPQILQPLPLSLLLP